MSKSLNIIRTIEDDDVVEDFSEDSDEEIEVSKSNLQLRYPHNLFIFQFQPSKQKIKKNVDFDTNFEFVSSVTDYNKDTWNDLTKYVKRKAKTKTDDKILDARKRVKDDGSDVEIKSEDEREQSDVSLSEDELKHDSIKVKEKKRKKSKQDDAESEKFFEEDAVGPYDESSTFYQMNLSRPLLKAVGELKYVHPTPIQAATIPVALLGNYWQKRK